MFDPKEAVEEAIKSNESEGHIFTQQEKELLLEYAEGKKTRKEVWEILDKVVCD